jgi:hypothetical protein
MGTEALPDLAVAPDDFDTAEADYFVSTKTDRDAAGNLRTAYPSSSIVSRFTAGWANRVDDTIRAIQRRLRGEVPIGTYNTPATDPDALLTWDAGDTRVRLRNADDSGYRDLEVGALYVGGVAVGSGLVTQSAVAGVDVSNSTDETTLATFTLPADTLDANGRRATMRIRGDIFNNGSARTATYRVYAGGSVIWRDDISHGNVSIRRPMHLDIELIRLSSTAQVMHGVISFGSANSSAPDGGEGTMSGAGNLAFSVLNDSLSLDETGTIVLSASVEHAVATANMRTRVQAAHLEVS